MGKNEFSWIAFDRAHEDAEQAREDFEQAVATEARTQAEDIRQQVQLGNADIISDLVDNWTDRLGGAGVAEEITRAALTFGPAAAGQLVADLIQKAIDAAAELAAIKEVEAWFPA